MASIRGMAFLGAVRYIKQTGGEELLARVVDDAGPVVAKTFAKRINGLGLQPYRAFTDFLVAMDRVLGRGDLDYCRQFGGVAARHDLETVFKVYTVRPSPEKMIEACTAIWGMYVDGGGHMEAVDTSPQRTVLRIHEFPEMAPAHCRMMEGWMIAAMDVVGVDVLPGACESECMSRGGRFHEFVCEWSLREG
ncbi:MAG: hypothetical protein R3B13_01600 [Polyangiaceae bacterium]